jgi:hypothetical protein
MTCATPVLIVSCMLLRSCYRVGMNLRSSVVTSIYNKALAISVASLSRKTIGEISNLMSVDSSRLQVREGLYGTVALVRVDNASIPRRTICLVLTSCVCPPLLG